MTTTKSATPPTTTTEEKDGQPSQQQGGGGGGGGVLPLMVSLSEIEHVMETTPNFPKRLLQKLASGFVAYERGNEFFQAPIQTLGVPAPVALPFRPPPPIQQRDGHDQEQSRNSDDGIYAAQTCVKTGYFANGTSEYFVLKIASGGHPFPQNWGCMQLFSQRTGALQAILLDHGILTELRTAAVGTLAYQTFLLAKHVNVERIGIIGTGIQARYQLDMLRHVCSCRNVLVYGRTPANVQTYVKEMQSKGHGWEFHIAQTANDLLQQCDVIITTTSSRDEPVLGVDYDYTSKTMRTKLIVCIGSDAPGKIELHPDLVESATVRVADHIPQSIVRGEYQTYYQNNKNKKQKDDNDDDDSTNIEGIISLGRYLMEHPDDGSTKKRKIDEETTTEDAKDDADGVADPSSSRRGEGGLIIFDSSGVAVQDCVIAEMVYTSLLQTESEK